MTTVPAVRCVGLRKSYRSNGNEVVALRGVDLEARAGEMLLLVGPSGCGKTTLLSVLAGVLDADGGEAEVFGASVTRMRPRQRTEFRLRNIGFVFQHFNLLPSLSNAENVAIPLLLRGTPRAAAVDKAVAELRLVGLEGREHDHPHHLSGGQQQRVAIARALVAEPRLIVCDEPTASLDGDTGARILQLLKDIAVDRERCIVVVTHDARVFRFGDRIAEMLDGRIVKVHDDPKELLHG
ncbi:MAG: ABC transporter ATP-binding protein [Planctomycetes bacterium]|nr:ABC transporter ATP-binding protein [Planctomycetota bacterium]